MKKSLLLFVISLYSVGLFSQAIDSTNSCVKKAMKLENKFKFYKAILQLEKCMVKSPDEAGLYYMAGLNHFWLNHTEEATLNFEKAISIDSTQFEEDNLLFMQYYTDPTVRIKESVDSADFVHLKPELKYRKQYTRKDTLQGLLTPVRDCFDITYHNLTVRINPEDKFIRGNNKITFQAVDHSDSIQIDLFAELEVLAIMEAEDSLSFRREHNAIFIQMSETLIPNQSYTIEIIYEGVPRTAPKPPWDGGFVWKEHNEQPYLGVSCEHLGASAWWPTKDHLSEKPDSMDIHIQVPDGLEVVSNGQQVEVRDLEGGYTDHHWHVSYPINNYNVTFYVADKWVNWQDEMINVSGDTMVIDYYVLEENLDTARAYYKKTKDIVQFFEKTFGPYPFPLDGLAFIESPYAGMEHQGAIAIGGEYGADEGYDVVNGYDRLVVHELAHEWWGNSISSADMADVWLQEGFATYSEYLFVEHLSGEQAYLDAVSDGMYYIVNAWPLVGNRGVNFNGFLGQDVYSKGAALLHNLRCLMGNDEMFFKMIKEFHQKYQQKPLRSEDFINHAQQYVSTSLKAFFEVFLYQENPPMLEYGFEHIDRNLTLWYEWVNVPPGFKMPILLSMDGWTVRILVTDERESVGYFNVGNFGLPNPNDPPYAPAHNSFTYYQSKWIR
ncbi:MAG: M1 family metallopeptidase [Reichenbachiella sp.]